MTNLFPVTVYILCFLTSAACSFLLLSSYRRSGIPLLCWSAICFLFLAGNNLILFLDLAIFTASDLQLPRLLLSLAAVVSLIWGFIWQSETE